MATTDTMMEFVGSTSLYAAHNETSVSVGVLCNPPNVSDNHTCTDSLDSITVRFVINTAIIGVCCIFGIIGNTVSLLVLGNDRTSKVAIFLLKVLAIVDNCLLLYSLLYLSLWYGLLPYVEHVTGSGAGIYHLSMPFMYTVINRIGPVFQALVIWITVLLAVNRYIAVCHPLHASNLCTLFKAKLQVAVVIVLVVLFHLPTYFLYFVGRRTIYNPAAGQFEERACLMPNEHINHQLFHLIHTSILSSIFIHILPLLLLCVLNSQIYREIRAFKSRTLKHNYITGSSKARVSETEGNISRVMLIIIVVFIVCQAPDRLSQVITPLRHLMHCHVPFLESIFNLLVIVNSSVNFLIYYFVRKSFRQILVQQYCSMSGRLSMNSKGGALPALRPARSSGASLLNCDKN